MRVEQRQLLEAVHHVHRVVDIQGDVLRRLAVALTPQVDRPVAQPQQGAQVGRILPARDGRLRPVQPILRWKLRRLVL